MIDFAPTLNPITTLDSPLVRQLGLHCRISPGNRANTVLTRDNFACVYCGTDLLASLDSLLTASLDHIIPKSAGGTRHTDNLVASCYPCNQLKSHALAFTISEGRSIIGRHRTMLVLLLRERFAALG